VILVTDLGYGFKLYAEPDTADPVFLDNLGRRFDPVRMARHPLADSVFRSVKRTLDIMDKEWRLPGRDARFAATDKAKIALQLALQIEGKWRPELLENEARDRQLEEAR
jgi:hypothetical protein